MQDKWECKDSPEQWWDQGLRNKFVENRFTVGSLVLARIEEWLTWPAMVPMVDNDTDTGYFSGQG